MALLSFASRRPRRIVRPTAAAITALVLTISPASVADAQATSSAGGGQPSAAPAARPADVASVDAIITALYDVISGPVGQKRDWDRLRSLFAPNAKMLPVLRNQAGAFAPAHLTPDDYIRRSGEMLEKFGFSEKEIARRTEQFGNIVHVWSTYEGKFEAPNPPVAPPRGINSIQLYNDGKRWYVLNLMWEAERADNKLPQRYLKTVPPER